MSTVCSKLTSFFHPVITDREKADNARNLQRINMRSDERAEDTIERREAYLEVLNESKRELKNKTLRDERKRKRNQVANHSVTRCLH